MAVSMEMMSQMIGEMQRMNSENLKMLMTQNFDALTQLIGTTKAPQMSMTDTRGIGRPITYKGDETKWAEWKAKLMAYLRVIAPRSDEVIQWVCKELNPVAEEDIDLKYGEHKLEVMKYSANLYSILLSCTEDDPSAFAILSRRATVWRPCVFFIAVMSLALLEPSGHY